MDEWSFVDDRELANWKGSRVCMTCQHFTYGVSVHCHTLVACNLRRQQLQQGKHLTKQCRHWAPTWESTVAHQH